MTKLESLKSLGHRFFVKHPRYKTEGTLLYRDGVYTFMPMNTKSFELSEAQAEALLEGTIVPKK